ncbi:DUF5131 family protein [Rhizobium sp. AQ_MP]|uniref:DUF5131 family protein n=1 Tax=Rhizobium sp. AQ_MP TaxID=2761536 RepID=UPI00163982BB|nr:DUF5131 family protein [Rhizobium sp. AQ_MP]MBC2773433.1 DUF5131 family protein [Rhizobium sp. AQ_MP]
MQISEWHPWSGCSPISPSCRACYAVPTEAGPLVNSTAEGRLVFNGKLRRNGTAKETLATVRGAMVAVLPHGDLFHENAPDEWLDDVFEEMEQSRSRFFMILTKRTERMLSYIERRYGGRSAPGNLGFGVSVERQKEATQRIRDLLRAQVQFRYLMFFSLVGPIDCVAIADASAYRSKIRQVMIERSKGDDDWYSEVTEFFRSASIPVTEHVLADEVAKRGF